MIAEPSGEIGAFVEYEVEDRMVWIWSGIITHCAHFDNTACNLVFFGTSATSH